MIRGPSHWIILVLVANETYLVSSKYYYKWMSPIISYVKYIYMDIWVWWYIGFLCDDCKYSYCDNEMV